MRQRYYDAQETRDPALRERDMLAALPAQVAHAKANTPFFSQLFARFDPREVNSRAALAALPVTRKSTLIELQKAHPPFGGLNATPIGRLARVFVSPGPIYDAEGHGADFWGTARALFAAGFREGDLVHNTFSYHFSPAASMFETGAHALGCAVIPAGTGQTEMQLAAIAQLKPQGYAGTPSFLKILIEKAEEAGTDISSLRRAVVSGEALFPAVREFLAARHIDAYQSYGTADLGTIAYESPAREGLIVSENILVEILKPGTGDPVTEGEVGEVVVTRFNRDYPLIRFATGDLSSVLPGVSPCGRTNTRIKGWQGRADQTTKVRGLFVHPQQVAEIVKRHAGIVRARLVVDQVNGADAMSLHCEAANGLDTEAVAASVRDVTKLRAEVCTAAVGSLPNDGKVIEDRRKIAV
ncbi:MAG: AMP-binding protein [Betaproteobacteria bacterium]|nr:AMP-binding protein [Betaproteobacteria bacterium]